MIILDVDGVLIERGTKIKQNDNDLYLHTKKIKRALINQIKNLSKKYYININSGRGLYMLQEMFREILGYVSITYENGSATWFRGKIYQHVNSFKELKEISMELIKVKDKKIKGFEPKEFIITIHCTDRVEEIEKIAGKYDSLYSLWNKEAYDIGIKNIQTKANGVRYLKKMFKLKKKEVLAIGDNYNDQQMLEEAGVKITSDKARLKGDYYIEFDPSELPVEILFKLL